MALNLVSSITKIMLLVFLFSFQIFLLDKVFRPQPKFFCYNFVLLLISHDCLIEAGEECAVDFL